MEGRNSRFEKTEHEGVWRLRPRGDAARCRVCGRTHPEMELDEAGWCRACTADLERKTRWIPHVIAGSIVLPFAIWIVLGGRFAVLPSYAWLLPLAAAYYLGYRIGREVVRGYGRWRRSRSVGVE